MNKVIKFFILYFIIFIAKLLPFNHILGSWHSAFSCNIFLSTSISNIFGFHWLTALFFCNKLLLAPSFVIFLRRIPLATLCAARAFKQREEVISIGLPLICMIMFMLHPIGSQASIYSLYWIIPPLLWLIKDYSWTRALQASFVAHAIGSVIWLYTGSQPAIFWINLIPIVIFERLLIALGIILCNEILKFIIYFYNCFYISHYSNYFKRTI